jgi:ribonuclease E
MLDAENPAESTTDPSVPTTADTPEGTDAPAKRAAAKKTAKKAPAKKTAAKKTAKKAPAKKAAAEPDASQPDSGQPDTEQPGASAPDPVQRAGAEEQAAGISGSASAPTAEEAVAGEAPVAKKAAKKAAAEKAPAKRAAKKTAAAPDAAAGTSDTGDQAEAADTLAPTGAAGADPGSDTGADTGTEMATDTGSRPTAPPPATALLFQPPDPTKAVTTRRRRTAAAKAETEDATDRTATAGTGDTGDTAAQQPDRPARRTRKQAQKAPEQTAEDQAPETRAEDSEDTDEEPNGERRRRRRGGRRRRKSGGGDGEANGADDAQDGSDSKRGSEAKGSDSDTATADSGSADDSDEGAGGTRRRRRRRRSEDGSDSSEPTTTSSRARKPRNAEDEITALHGSTRLEAKKQRRREGREAGRRRAPIVSEAEFLARREAVDRTMVIRQKRDLTQIAVLEDNVLVEHYVARESQTSLIGNVYLGRVQNVLPSMEAAFIDIGKGRNAVLYAGEVNWDSLGAKNGTPRKIEAVLKSGQPILVQVTKDPIGHKGARLTSQISLPGRFLVYVPDGTTSGISRKLPDTERNRLKTLLKDIVPDTAGVIVRTAAEGASEEELTRDVERLTARWTDIEGKVKGGNAPQLLYGEPDLTLKVVRDLFTEDFGKLVISGDDAWDMVQDYVTHVAPDLSDRLERYDDDRDVFATYRIDEQIEKALDRKVWLPSGGSLVIDRTEAMTVVDVNTGKFTGSGGNLEETVTKNNLEAAEEIVRQLRLRDIGGIIVVDFIDMVLESNRDLVLRRMVECLGRDRTRHQVAEVTSLGLVQMTRKRIGTGLLEAFSESCDHCGGRGLVLHHEPVEPKKKADDEPRRGRRSGGGRDRDKTGPSEPVVPSPRDVAAMAKPENRAGNGAGDTDEHGSSDGRAPAPESAPETAPHSATQPDTGSDAGPSAETSTRRRSDRSASRPEAHARDDADGVTTETSAGPAGDEAGEPAAPKTSTRTRGGRGRGGRGKATREEAPAGVPVETAVPAPVETATPAAPETAGAPGAGTDPAASEDRGTGGAETGTAAAPEPTQPRIVTTVRRRSARRPAGPPPGAAAGAGVTAGTGGDTDTLTVPESDDDEDLSLGGAAREPLADEPLATVVDSAEVEGDDGEPAPAHVPVKKKGSRRR